MRIYSLFFLLKILTLQTNFEARDSMINNLIIWKKTLNPYTAVRGVRQRRFSLFKPPKIHKNPLFVGAGLRLTTKLRRPFILPYFFFQYQFFYVFY